MAVLRVYAQPLRKHWIPASAAFFATIFASAIGIITPLYYRQFLDLVAAAGTVRETGPLINILLVILAINLVGWAVRRVSNFSSSYIESVAMNELSQNAFADLLQHSYSFFTNSFTGSLVRRITRLSRSFEDVMDRFFGTLLPLIVSLVGITVVLFFRSHLLGWLFLIWTITFIALQCVLALYKMSYGIKAAEKDSESTGALSDALSNETAVKLFTAGDHERSRFGKIADELAHLRFASWRFDEYINLVQGLFTTVIEFALMYAGVLLWKQGTITIGDFALIQAYLINAISQLWNFGNTLRRIYESFTDATEMVEIMNMPLEIVDVPGAGTLRITDGMIAFNDVSFNFKSGHSVLKNFNLSIAANEKVGLVGLSGAGKTTITKLLLRLYDVTGGEITIDEKNIATVTQDSLRDAIALVPQEPILFHRSLMENICYGKRDATNAEVIEAAKQAHCYEFISKYPLGFETFVGERGVKLSGGERQRVAIARAILKNAPILILDEATSSLDSESEALIQGALAKLMEGKTVIAIAHRLSTIMKMDRIIVMEKGSAVLSGTHAALLAHESNLYKKLWEIQAGGFLLEEDEK